MNQKRTSVPQLTNQESEIVNYLKLRKFDKTQNPPEIELVSDVEVAADLEISKGVPVARQLLEGLETKGIVKRDRYGNWGLSQRVELLTDLKTNKDSHGEKVDSPKIDRGTNSSTNSTSRIKLIHRDGKLFAKVKDLKRHPLNQQIYSHNNVEARLEKIKRSGWIETLTITPFGLIISGNTRHECAEILEWEQVQVEVRELANEREEVKALLLYNSSREKTKEELCREAMVWESIEKEEAEERQKAGLKIPDLSANLHEGSENINKGRASSHAAKQVGLKHRNYEKMKKVVKAADRLKEDNRTVAAKKLLNTLNSGSTDAAYKQIKDLNKVEGAIDSLKQSKQEEGAKILEQILENHTIKDAIEQMSEWESEYKTKQRKSQFQHLDVVRILGNECRGQWAILDTIDEFHCTLMTATANLEFVPLTEIEKIELSEEKKRKAYDLMIRLQRSSYQLQGKNEPLAHQIIQYVAKKQSPALSILEEVYLYATEVFLIGAIEEIRKRSLEVLNMNYPAV